MIDVTFDIDWRTGLLVSRWQAQVSGELFGIIKVGEASRSHD